MKIQYVSDLHLELADNSRYIKKHPLPVVGDVLLIAGDTGYFGTDQYKNMKFWKWCSENYKTTIVCPGNHEFYNYYDVKPLLGISEVVGTPILPVELAPNVFLCYNSAINIGDIDVIVSTLWGEIKPNDVYITEHSINDFYRIKWGDHRLSAEHFNELNADCKMFITKAVAESNAKTKIVLTHHLPSPLLVAPEYKNSNANGAFMCDMTSYIMDSDIDYWVYGHSHNNIDYQIGNTRLIANQMGYIFNCENIRNGFKPDKFIEIPE